MTQISVNTRMRKPLSRLLPWAVAIATLGASAIGHAANGEADVFEADAVATYRSMGTTPSPMQEEQAWNAQSSSTISAALDPARHSVAVMSPAPDTSRITPTTRADVRESLQTATAANLMLRNGEIAEPQDLMQAREDFIAMQTEQLQNEYMAAVAENERLARLEQDRQAEAERIAQLVDEATDRIAMRPEEVEIWVEPGTTVQELVSYIEQSENPDAVAVLLVEQPEPAADRAD